MFLFSLFSISVKEGTNIFVMLKSSTGSEHTHRHTQTETHTQTQTQKGTKKLHPKRKH